ncbi:MAG: type II toxin-antitoxin system RelE/ParE family toxin [Roseivirga sp.]|jgi:toxin YoeB|uniref:type II toxin-antitoxin system RelE/ParE family toxin n=1 Tax=Roseivirga sp. TaxID=1964215 RepID=UPI001B0B1D3F|nr:type II toxin-antitoxin system RelE/ParE family toxin [Roseivirga sp.]MBO6497387.1 type II toxin-antitoxin system RelE/ParE family toxin [Roseivirga sp.]
MTKTIKWTTRSILDRTDIYKYWLNRNKSDAYSEKSAELISNYPHIGMQTNYRNVFSKVVKDYKIFYRVSSNEIQILRVWDTRQRPESMKLSGD